MYQFKKCEQNLLFIVLCSKILFLSVFLSILKN